MTAIEKLYAKIKELGVENTEDLPAKTKRKIAEFEKLYNNKSAVHINKNGQRNPSVIEKLNDLAEDILEETEIFVLEQKEKNAPPPQPPKPPQTPKPEPKKDFFDWLFG